MGSHRERVSAEAQTGSAALTDVVRLRVRYDEGDQMGITYHARYLDWFVIGRTELLRSIGLPYAQLERNGLLLPVLEAHCRYLGSTRYDDIVELETTLTQVQRTRLTFRYEVRLLGSDAFAGGNEFTSDAEQPVFQTTAATLVTTGETKHVFVDARQRPIDVRKHFPAVWQRLAPLADLIGAAQRRPMTS